MEVMDLLLFMRDYQISQGVKKLQVLLKLARVDRVEVLLGAASSVMVALSSSVYIQVYVHPITYLVYIALLVFAILISL